jgi:hypothetical protein
MGVDHAKESFALEQTEAALAFEVSLQEWNKSMAS